MSKRKVIQAPMLEVADELIGNRILVVCPTCGGFGGVMTEGIGWKVCKKCDGGGRVWKEDATEVGQ